MRNYSLVLLITVLCCLHSACYYSEADSYIQDHTEYDWYDDTPEGFVVDFLMERSADVGKTAVSSKTFLRVNSTVYEYTGNKYDDLKSVTMWVSASRDSWNAFNEISPDGSPNYDNTMAVFYDNSSLDTFVLAMNWRLWLEGSQNDILYFYVHELIHFISSQENAGDSDYNHAREEYWGPDGLFEQLLYTLEITTPGNPFAS
jgi:hypothetical protein